MPMSEDHLSRIYAFRFSGVDSGLRNDTWREIVRWLSAAGILRPDDVVADVACGTGEFINAVENTTRYGLDKVGQKSNALHPGVVFLPRDVNDLAVSDFTVGRPTLFFISNFLEHLDNKSEIVTLFDRLGSILDRGGRVVVMGPNIRFIKGSYWDFVDHNLALTEKAVEEAMGAAGFSIRRSYDRFLPYSFKSALPKSVALVRAYLHFPVAWKVLGKQFLVVGEK